MAADVEPVTGWTRDAYRQARYLEWIVLWLLFVILAITYIVSDIVLRGDWDFWVDEKDTRWWLTVSPAISIFYPAFAQAFLWYVCRWPFGATFAVMALYLGMWIDRIFNWNLGPAILPINMVWPSLLIPGAILLDGVLLMTRSWIFTGMIGGFLWSFAFWLGNSVIMLPFRVPIEYNGDLMSTADMIGFNYVRTNTPDYLRIIEKGTFRLAVGSTEIIATFFGGFLAMNAFFIWWHIGSWTLKVFPTKWWKLSEI